jgi:hypothetical protein
MAKLMEKVRKKSCSDTTSVVAKKSLIQMMFSVGVNFNCPSSEGFKYTIVFTDEATNQFWIYICTI